MDAIFKCPCDAGQHLGDKVLALQIVGLADNILYRTIVLLEDPNDPIDKLTGRRKQYGIMPCREGCRPPQKGVVAPPRNTPPTT